MHHFVDRRQNPKGKSLGNRQRFLRRARHHIKDMVDRSIKDRSMGDLENGEQVTIPTKGIKEPHLVHSPNGGKRERIFPGNKEFVVGDSFPRPKQGGGKGQGKQASEDGEGEDAFTFTLTREEFLELLFEDLELPDLVKTTLKETTTVKQRKAGLATQGTPANLNLIRTMRNSLGRRIALKRPSGDEVAVLEAEIAELEAKENRTAGEAKRLEELKEQLEALERRRKIVSFIDPVDIRYNSFVPEIIPNSKAVMFCLMDVSGSMAEREKELAKRFFLLLHLFLERRYEHTEIVFIRHTHYAQEVDEETFFYGRETGGTVVSTALEEMEKIVKDRYPTGEWNIYAAQASDGENLSRDSLKCEQLLEERLMPVCQFYAYVEIVEESEMEILASDEAGGELWRAYREVRSRWPNFDMRRIAQPSHIYPVFRDFFSSKKEGVR